MTNNDMASFLMHHGIKGQRWGIRRFQETNGKLTPEGQIRYGIEQHKKENNDAASGIKSYIRRKKEERAEKKERMQKAEELNKERSEIRRKEYDRLQKASKEYNEAQQEIVKLERRKKNEDFDENSPDDMEKYRDINDHIFKRLEDIERLEQEFDEKATKKSFEKIRKKYGDEAVSEIKYYQSEMNKQGARLLISMLAAPIAISMLYKVAKKH